MTVLKSLRHWLGGMGLLAAISAGLMLADHVLVTPSQAASATDASEAPNSPATQSSVQSARSSWGHVLLGSSPSATQPAPGAVNATQPAPANAAKEPPADSVAEVSKLYEEMGLPLGASREYNYSQQRNGGEEPTGVITGQVLTEDGSPLEGSVSGYILSDTGTRNIQIEGGAFTAMAPVGRVWLVVRAEAWVQTLSGPYTVKADEPLDDVSVVLSRGQSLQVKVTDPKGNPIPDARVSYYVPARNMSFGSQDVSVGAEGFHTIEHLPEGTVNVIVTAPGYCQWSRQVDAPQANAVQVVMAPVRPVVGHVIAKDTGKPIANARVYLASDSSEDPRWNMAYNPGSVQVQTQSDEQGNFTLMSDIGDGSRLMITTDDHRSLVSNPVSPGQTVTFKMPAPLYVHGHFKGDLSKLGSRGQGEYEFTWSNVNPIPWGYGERMASMRAIAHEVDGKVEFDLHIVFPGKFQIQAGNYQKEMVLDKPIEDLEIDLDAQPETNGPSGSAAPADLMDRPVAPALHVAPALPDSGRMGRVAVSRNLADRSVTSPSQRTQFSALPVAMTNPSAAGDKRISPVSGRDIAGPGVIRSGSIIAAGSLGVSTANAGDVVQVQDVQTVQAIPPSGAIVDVRSGDQAAPAAKDPTLRPIILKFIPPPGAKEAKGMVQLRGVGGRFDGQWLEIKDNQVTFDAKVGEWVQYELRNLPGAVGRGDNVQVPAGDGPITKEIRLNPAGAIRCTVVDEADQPVRTGRVQWISMSANWSGYEQGFQGGSEAIEGNTDIEGEYLMSPVPLNVPVAAMIYDGSHNAISQPVTLTAAHPVADVKLVISAGQTVKVHVIDPEGQPAGGRTASIQWSPRQGYSMGGPGYKTDGAGDIILNHVNLDPSTGGKYSVMVQSGGEYQTVGAVLTADKPEITLQLKRGLSAHGIVIDAATGRPAVGLQIQSNATQSRGDLPYSDSHSAITDEEGHFEFTGLSDGEYHIYFQGPIQMKPKPRLWGMGSARRDPPTFHGGQTQEIRMEVQPYPGAENAYRLGAAPTTQPAGSPATQPAAH